MIRYMLCIVCVVVCVALQMGWKEVAAVYRKNYMREDTETTTDEEHLFWTYLHAPTVGSGEISLDAATIESFDKLVLEESTAVFSSNLWNPIFNDSAYTIESMAVKSNTVSVMENPMIRIRLQPMTCVSVQHLMHHMTFPQSLMSTFFPLFHLYESKSADSTESEALIQRSDDIVVTDDNMKTVMASSIDRSIVAELRTVIAPLIWPFEQRELTLLNWFDADAGVYRSRSVGMRKQASGDSLATTSMSLVINVTAVQRNETSQRAECTCQILLHSANVLPHPMVNFFFQTDYLAPRIAQYFDRYSKYFFSVHDD